MWKQKSKVLETQYENFFIPCFLCVGRRMTLRRNICMGQCNARAASAMPLMDEGIPRALLSQHGQGCVVMGECIKYKSNSSAGMGLSKHSTSKRQIHHFEMFRKFKVLVVVATLATVGQCQPLDTQLQGRGESSHFFGRFARDVSDDDTVGQITGLLEDGGKIPKKAMAMMKSQLKNFDKLLKEADGNIAKIQRELGKIGEIDITREYLDAYWQAKKELRLARTDLRELALRTTAAVQDIKILMEDWDNQEVSFIEKEFLILKSLIEECLRVLKDAKVKYTNAINEMEKTSNQLFETKTSLSLMLDEKSSEYSSWTEKVRGGTYGSAGLVTVGMIFADIFGCLGNISLYTT